MKVSFISFFVDPGYEVVNIDHRQTCINQTSRPTVNVDLKECKDLCESDHDCAFFSMKSGDSQNECTTYETCQEFRSMQAPVTTFRKLQGTYLKILDFSSCTVIR